MPSEEDVYPLLEKLKISPGGGHLSDGISSICVGQSDDERKHGLSTEQVPVSAYVGSSKNLKDEQPRNLMIDMHPMCSPTDNVMRSPTAESKSADDRTSPEDWWAPQQS